MARGFGEYSPDVPLGTTWEETLALQGPTGLPVNLAGYAVRAQLYEDIPERDPDTGLPIVPPVMEITSDDYYSALPSWPVIEGFTIPDPANGEILELIEAIDTWRGSPDNAGRKLHWSILLVNPSTGYTIPVVEGVVVFLRARTM